MYVSILNFRDQVGWTYAELRRGVDELELDLLEVSTAGVYHQTLPDGDDTLLGSGDRALEHHVVVLHNTVVRETAHGCDGLLRDVGLGRSVSGILTRTDAVHLLVELGTVVVTV